MSRTLLRLALLKTTAERVVDDMSDQLLRPKDAQELQRRIAGRVTRAANSSFGHRDKLLLDAAAEMDELILGARKELGIETLTPDDHLARLEANGPWLQDLDLGDTREWPVAEVEPGRWASVNHELRMLGPSTGSPAAAASVGLRSDEPVLRKLRRRYEDRYPAPSDLDEKTSGPEL